MKKLLSIIICLILMFSVLPISAFAVSEEEQCSVESTAVTGEAVGLKDYLFEAFYNCEEIIDVSGFNLGYNAENRSLLHNLIYNEMVECFHIQKYSVWYTSAQILRIVPQYSVSASEYQRMYAEVSASKEKLLQGIKGNDELDEVQKALLIHDRLALVCEYDYQYTDNMSDIYGALVNGKAVCQGYAEAYMYLLDDVGMESYLCESVALNHVWNIVYVNGTQYHVDVTWDDYAWQNGERGVVGVVAHDNFLRSSNGIYSTGHSANDYDTTPNDTTYDGYFWQYSESAFQLIGNELYYVDNWSGELKRYSDNKAICEVSGWWMCSHGYWYNYARLSGDGTNLYYSLNDAVYKFDVSTETSTEIFRPQLSGYDNIYGFQYSDGYLICDINEEPPYASCGSIDKLYQIKEPYEAKIPVAGDVNGDDGLTSADAVYLLYSVLYGDTEYPIGQDCDFDGDGYVTEDDAVYLLYHILFAGEYPLN